MSYQYAEIKPNLFTDEGQRLFLSIRDRTNSLLSSSGAVRLQEAISKHTGDSWEMIACMDRMVELGEIEEITNNTCGQYRVFVKCG